MEKACAGPVKSAADIRRSGGDGVANGTRTRNNQNHNLELYH